MQLTPSWSDVLSESQISTYERIVRTAVERNIPFALGGSLCMAVYAGCIRRSKDLDIYVMPEGKDWMIQLLTDLGLQDYYSQVVYDRSWIYRGTVDDQIVDVIWTMANHRTEVDDHWIQRGPHVEFAGKNVRLIPIEEMIWSKLYVLQRDRCDWPDLINLIDRSGHRIDWRHLNNRLGEDVPLLGAVLTIYAWLRPERVTQVPSWLWREVEPHPRQSTQETTRHRACLIDSRPWLLGTMNGEKNPC